ncbi:MAG: glycoside hydrolase family 6 [Frankiales bacterium]|nr:glycoside hydrolase family 6 [Frankiales bacterium]
MKTLLVRRLLTLLLLLLVLLPAPSEAATGDPFTGHRPLVEHDRTVDRAMAASSGSTRRALAVIAAQPQARWYGDGLTGSRLTADVATRTARAGRAGASSVLVAYALPHRGCGSSSAGGLTAAGYRSWVDALASGVRGTRVAVVLEPDSLAQLDCLSTAQKQERLALLRDAVGVLVAHHAVVYLDAGHAGWTPVPTMAARLRSAGIALARGVSVNVSSFGRTADEVSYARALARAVPGLHAVIDTSRNGRGPAAHAAWCNPAGRGLGSVPRAVADVVVDALLWVKAPGESDGSCGRGEPAAGSFWTPYGVGLVGRRAR